METNTIPELLYGQVSGFIADRMGLHFPPERRRDLERGLSGAAGELGFADAGSFADWLLSAPLTQTQIQVLASHLTVGETYFFRDKKAFDALSENLLPALIRSRRDSGRRLRLWSAACCTGEEPYSLAIMMRQLIPDLTDWSFTLLATDINARFLRQAVAGVYGEWSFRDVPPGFKDRCFRRRADGRHAILPEIQELVSFAYLNLVEDSYPSLETDTNAMDVIFCRNVLMYFTPGQARKVVGKLSRALLPGGWLVVSPSEGSPALFSGFDAVNFPGAILYQKNGTKIRDWKPGVPSPPIEVPEFVLPAVEAPLPWVPPAGETAPALPEEAQPSPYGAAVGLYQQGRYAEASDMLLASAASGGGEDPGMFPLLARALANQGKLADALAWCERWTAADKLDPSGHYLRAMVLRELGDSGQARLSFQRALYLDQDFALAHFALGNLERDCGKNREADRHYANARHLLQACAPEEILPESGGLTAGRLMEIITSLAAMEAMA